MDRSDAVRQLANQYVATGAVAAVVLAGSLGRGRDDVFSDVELDVYWARPPTDDQRREPAAALGGEITRLWPYDADDAEWSEEVRVLGVDVTVSGFHADEIDRWIASPADPSGPNLLRQLRISAILEGTVLYGEPVVAAWRRAAAYPRIGDGPIFLSGISFGGLIALRYAIAHGTRLSGLVPMSCFAELSPQLLLLGNALRTGLILGGTSYLQDLLLPMNLSNQWLKPLLDKLDGVKRQGWLVNDVCALQNLMESFLDFEPLTPQLASIGTPTMILNGEFDFLTPRALHETLRVHIPNSSLVIIPRAYHAFTLEKPALTADLLARFAEDVLAGRWQGNKAVWIASEEAGGALAPFPAGYDHLRAIPTQGAIP